MNVYLRLLRAENIAWLQGNVEKAIILARWKARAYKMYSVETLYY